MKGSLIDEMEGRESNIMSYFPVILKLEIPVRQRNISVSSEMRTEADLGWWDE